MQHPHPSSQAEPPPPPSPRRHLSTSRAVVLYFPPATTHSPRVSRQLILGQTPVWFTGLWWSVRIRDHTNTHACTHTHTGFFSALLTHTRQGERERIEKKGAKERRLHLRKCPSAFCCCYGLRYLCVCVRMCVHQKWWANEGSISLLTHSLVP